MRQRTALLLAGAGIVALGAFAERTTPAPAAPNTPAPQTDPLAGFAPALEGARLDQYSPLHDVSHVSEITEAMPVQTMLHDQSRACQPFFGTW